MDLDAAGAWHGDSGSPVVNKEGELIGLIKTTDKETKTYAVSMQAISTLMNELERKHIFWIANDTKSIVQYEIKWSENEPWEPHTLEPDTELKDHTGKYHQMPDGYPKIRYIPDQQDLKKTTAPDAVKSTTLQSNETDETGMYTEQVLKTKYQFFGKDVKERVTPELDGYNFRFVLNSQSKQIELHEQRETVWIANHTNEYWVCEIEWAGDSPNTSYRLEPNTARPHWNPTSVKSRKPYPQILIHVRIQHKPDDTVRTFEVKRKALVVLPEFFPIIHFEGPERFSIVQEEEIKHIQTDSKKFISDKVIWNPRNYYFLEMSSENGILEVHNGIYAAATELEKYKGQQKGWKYWFTFVGLVIVVVVVLLIMRSVFKKLKQRGLLLWLSKNNK